MRSYINSDSWVWAERKLHGRCLGSKLLPICLKLEPQSCQEDTSHLRGKFPVHCSFTKEWMYQEGGADGNKNHEEVKALKISMEESKSHERGTTLKSFNGRWTIPLIM